MEAIPSAAGEGARGHGRLYHRTHPSYLRAIKPSPADEGQEATSVRRVECPQQPRQILRGPEPRSESRSESRHLAPEGAIRIS